MQSFSKARAGALLVSAIAAMCAVTVFGQVVSPAEAQLAATPPLINDKTIVINPADRIEYFINVGWSSSPVILYNGDTPVLDDDVSNRAVPTGDIKNGWQGRINHIRSAIESRGLKTIHLHNMFGSASFHDEDLDNDGEPDAKPGRRIMQMSQYTDSYDEWTQHPEWAQEYFAATNGEPALHATMPLWTDVINEYPDVTFRFYIGSPHNDYYVQQLRNDYGDMSQELWDHIWANVTPFFDVGFQAIGIDNTASEGGQDPVTKRMIEVLAHPELRDTQLDAALLTSIGDRSVVPFVEAKPKLINEYQYGYNILAKYQTWINQTGRGIYSNDDSVFYGDVSRLYDDHDPTEAVIEKLRRALDQGHRLLIRNPLFNHTESNTTQKIINLINPESFDTIINLRHPDDGSGSYSYVIDTQPQYGSLVHSGYDNFVFTYRPTEYHQLTDSFSYHVLSSDGQQSNNAVITLLVQTACGNNTIDAGESCDDDSELCISCQSAAASTPVCGNGVLEDGEDCDDANQIDTDTCSNSCTSTQTDGISHIIHISVDGLGAQLLEPLLDSMNLPAFQRLRTEGASTLNARTDFTHTLTLPNHTSMLTGRPVSPGRGVSDTDYHGYTENVTPDTSDTLHNSGNPNLDYIASTFDVVHDGGYSTAFFASKQKFMLYEQSYNETNGAPHPNGSDKIDVTFIDEDSQQMQDRFLQEMAANHFNYTFVHYDNLDNIGHGIGWGTTEWITGVATIDSYLTEVLNMVDNDPVLDGTTVVIITADHGGEGQGHGNAANPVNFTIPVFVWGSGIAAADLYELNQTIRSDPGIGRFDYAYAGQPIRNGDTGNLALDLLGLGPVPGSMINAAQDLQVRNPVCGNGLVELGEECDAASLICQNCQVVIPIPALVPSSYSCPLPAGFWESF